MTDHFTHMRVSHKRRFTENDILCSADLRDREGKVVKLSYNAVLYSSHAVVDFNDDRILGFRVLAMLADGLPGRYAPQQES